MNYKIKLLIGIAVYMLNVYSHDEIVLICALICLRIKET